VGGAVVGSAVRIYIQLVMSLVLSSQKCLSVERRLPVPKVQMEMRHR